MIKVNSIKMAQVSFKGKEDKIKTTKPSGYFTKNGSFLLPEDAFDSSKKQSDIGRKLQIRNIPLIDKAAISTDKLFFIPTNVTPTINRANDVYVNAYETIYDVKEKLDKYPKANCDKKVLEEFSTGKKPVLLRKATLYSDGYLAIDDYKNGTRIIQDGRTTYVSVGVDYKHAPIDSIWARQMFEYQDGVVTSCANNIQTDNIGKGATVRELLGFEDGKLARYAKEYSQKGDGSFVADQYLSFFDGQIDKAYTGYTRYYDDAESASDFYQFENGRQVLHTKDYLKIYD